MKELIVEAIQRALGKERSLPDDGKGVDLLLKFAGKVESPIRDGSTRHDEYLAEG